ncbi:MAG: hypothetical protein ACOX6D_06535 [Thermoguttaceae bacterium]|jgi:hypothetical protein
MPTPSEEKLEQTLRRTSSLIRRVDVGVAFLAVSAAAVFLLLIGIFLDHLCRDGMPERARILYAIVSGLVLLAVTLWKFYPTFRYRVNPLYSALKLESAHPQLKNGLVNWLLVRGRKSTLFVRQLSVKTAETIPPHAESEAIDMRPLVRCAMVFIAAVTLLSLYLVTSEKSGFVSAARVMLPTAKINPPQRVRFRAIKPKDASFYPGKEVLVEVEFLGDPRGDVFFSYSTPDGRISDRRLPMEESGFHLYRLSFPESGKGLEEDILYSILVTDGKRERARSPRYTLTVLPPIRFAPSTILYRYPEYTGLQPRQVENDGTIDAWEGTEVVLTARSTHPLARALLIPDFSPNRAVKMKILPDDPTSAEATFTLEPGKIASYQLRCTDTEQNGNFVDSKDEKHGVPVWEVTVRSDPAPVAAWENGVGASGVVAENGTVRLAFTASDENFGLAQARLEVTWWKKSHPAEKHEKKLDLSNVPDRPGIDRRAQVLFALDFSPAANGIPAGAAVECRGVVFDNREPQPNRGETSILTLEVVQPAEIPEEESPSQPEEGASDGRSEGENGGGNSREGEEGESQNSGDSGKNQNASGGGSDSEETPSSGEPSPNEGANPGGEEDNAEGTGESAGDPTEEGDGDAPSESGAGEAAGGESTDAAPNRTAADEGEGESERANEALGRSDGQPEGAERDAPENTPIDPDSDPAGAFDTILDFSGLEAQAVPSDAEPQGRGTGISSPESEKRSADPPEEDLDKIKSAEGIPPADGPRRSDDRSRIPADAARENGPVDPGTRNYMATDGEGDDSATVPKDAKIQPDPNASGRPSEAREGEGRPTDRKADGGVPDDRGDATPSQGDLPETAGETSEKNPGSPSDAQNEGDPSSGQPVPGGGGNSTAELRRREAAPADEANLQYAEAATNLVLSYLDQQLNQGVDQGLLDELGWSEAELRAFRDRWQAMRKKAKETPSARRGYEEELRDLGLRPKAGVRISARSADAKGKDSVRSFLRVPPPPGYEERLRAYREAINRAAPSE